MSKQFLDQPGQQNNLPTQNSIDNQTVSQLEKKEKTFNWFFIIWNIISVLGYVLFIFYSISQDISGPVVNTLMIVGLVVYVIIFIGLFVFSNDKSKLKSRLKNYKTTAKILKKVLQMYNLVLSIGLLVQSLKSFSINKIFSLLFSLFMIFVIVVGLIIDICSIIYRKKIDQKKQSIKDLIKQNIKELRE